jgi:hypothetical protein
MVDYRDKHITMIAKRRVLQRLSFRVNPEKQNKLTTLWPGTAAKKELSVGELNPGLPRTIEDDRRKY